MGRVTRVRHPPCLRGLSLDDYTRCIVEAEENRERKRALPLTSAVMTAVADTYGSLPRDVVLRTGDAVHLLSAREHGLRRIYSNDRRLLAAAPYVGMTGLDVIGGAAIPRGLG